MRRIDLFNGDCLDVLKSIPDNSIDSIVTDPPYGLSKEPDMAEVLTHWLAGDDYQHKGGGFMGKSWDSFVPGPSVWRECLRVLKPGGHLLAFFGSRTQDLGTLAIRLAGFEIRDSIAWVYGSGFPKSANISKQIDKAAGAKREVIGEKGGRYASPKQDFRGGSLHSGADTAKKSLFNEITAPATDEARQWDGWGTALKPAHEPITMARKPFKGTTAANVISHGTGALNIDASRIPLNGDYKCKANGRPSQTGLTDGYDPTSANQPDTVGRWPANLIHDGSDGVIAIFPAKAGAASPVTGMEGSKASTGAVTNSRERVEGAFHDDAGSAARFFYCAKASPRDRHEGLDDPGPQFAHGGTLREYENGAGGQKGNYHPTVKPTELMRYLCRLVTPPGGVVLDPFAGSGSTGKGAVLEGFGFVGIEQDTNYVQIAIKRIIWALNHVGAIDANAA